MQVGHGMTQRPTVGMTLRCCVPSPAGDEDALAALYDRHAAWLTIRLSRRCSRPDVVDQAVQDTFLAVWRGASGYREARRRRRLHLGHRGAPA